MRPGVAAHILPSRGSCASQAPCFPYGASPQSHFRSRPFRPQASSASYYRRGNGTFLCQPLCVPVTFTVREKTWQEEGRDAVLSAVTALARAGTPVGQAVLQRPGRRVGTVRAVGAPCTQGWKAEALPWVD